MSFDLVLFGGTGDLAWRKLLPALFQAFRHGTLPEGGRIISVARDDLTDDQYRSRIQMRFDDVELAKRPTPQEFSRFAALLHHLRMDLSQPQDYGRLADMIKARNADSLVMYVATAPSLFTTVCEQIAAVGLNGPATRVVLGVHMLGPYAPETIWGAAAALDAQPGFQPAGHVWRNGGMAVDHARQRRAADAQLPRRLGNAQAQRGQHVFFQGQAGMGRVEHARHGKQASMIVLVIHQDDVFAIKAKGQPPVAIDPDRPMLAQIMV